MPIITRPGSRIGGPGALYGAYAAIAPVALTVVNAGRYWSTRQCHGSEGAGHRRRSAARCLACRMARCAAAAPCRVQFGRRSESRSTKHSSTCGGKSALISGSHSSISEREDRSVFSFHRIFVRDRAFSSHFGSVVFGAKLARYGDVEPYS